MELRTEKAYPVGGGCLAVAIFWLATRDRAEPEAFATLFSNTISLAGIAVGFLATAQSIMLSVGERRLLRQFRQIGYEKHLHQYFMDAIHSSFGLGIVSGLCLLADAKSEPSSFRQVTAVWLFVLCLAVLSYYRIVSLFMKVLSSPAAKTDRP